MGERPVDDLYGFKYLKEKDFIKLKNALFGNQPIKSSAAIKSLFKTFSKPSATFLLE